MNAPAPQLVNSRSHPVRRWLVECTEAWDRFWFEPSGTATLAAMRLATGWMLFYTHFVWGLELETFFADTGIISGPFHEALHARSPFVFSHFDWIDSALWRWTTHILALVVFLAFTVGWKTRVASVLAAFFAISYAHRATGALFGLDQINCFLAVYLALSPCGRVASVDSWLRRRHASSATGTETGQGGEQFVLATVATRLIQVHLCIVYLFAGLGKLQGPSWWDGTAIWGAVASLEYQTVDLTFLANSLWAANLITLVTLFWECSYPFLIWPRLTRPIWLLLAVLVHLGIGICMGMLTFGIIMVIANMAFVQPETMQQWLGRLTRQAR